MIRPDLIVPPSVLPVSTAEVKMHSRIDHGDDDDLIDVFIGAAVGHLDGYAGILGRCLINQQWAQGFVCWSACMRLVFPDVSEVVLNYYDADGVEQTVAATDYEVIEGPRGAEITFKDSFSSPGLDGDRRQPVKAAFTAGFGATADDVPPALRTAIMMLVAHWYENREAVGNAGDFSNVPLAFDALVGPYRRFSM